MNNPKQQWETWASNLHVDLVNDYLPSDMVMRLSKILSYLKNVDREANLIDVGCGDGHLMNLLERDGFRHLLGTEYSSPRIAYARNRLVPHSPLVSCDGLYLPFPDGQFGVVVSVAVIEHVPNQERFISELSRITSKGGRVLLVTDCFLYRIDQWVGIYSSRFPIDNAPFPPTLMAQCRRYNLKLLGYDAWGTSFHHIRMALHRVFSGLSRIFSGLNLLPPSINMSYPCGDRKMVDIPIGFPIQRKLLLRTFLKLFFEAESIFVLEKI